jgi:hypothetical protein
VTSPEEVPPVEMVPAAVEAHLDHVARELVEGRVEPVELGGVRDGAAVGLLQRVAVRVGHEAHAVASAHRAVVGSLLADVATGPDELRMGVAHVTAADDAATEISQYRPLRQCVVDVSGHPFSLVSAAGAV